MNDGGTSFFIAVKMGHMGVMSCLAGVGADVNKGLHDGTSPLYIAAQEGHLDVVHFLVKELGADVNQRKLKRTTPLMVASLMKHTAIVKWLVKAGADPQVSDEEFGIAADVSKLAGASAEQTAYLEAKAHCSHPDCSGPGLMKCTGCLQARYCGEACQQVHWSAHKADCKRWKAARLAKDPAANGTPKIGSKIE
jgi:hypothetical protein